MFLGTAISVRGQTSIANHGCGAQSVWFNLKLEPARPAAQPEPGKALVYFVERVDDLDYTIMVGSETTTRVGLDGAWVGAMKNKSYFIVSVEPGEHDVCVSRQAHWPENKLMGFAHFTAEAGRVYYFFNRYMVQRGPNPAMQFGQAPLSEIQFMIYSYRVSVSHPKK